MKYRSSAAVLLVLLTAATFTAAQGTNGSLEGKATDQQGLALPGVTVTARNTGTGFQRTAITDATGAYRLNGLPFGTYEVRAELAGFATVSRKAVTVNVAATTSGDFRMNVATQQEEVTVTAEAPLIDVTDTGISEVVSQAQIENLPLNGRQFGNLAALVPGVGLGYHSDPTKSTQFAPQVAGGGGRNINYLIDGGDNNDDTVGGLVQNFPLDSIGEFNFKTQRFRAEYGRASGGVLTVVTKSGTNEFAGSVFNYFRDKGLNARTETEKINDVPKGDYRKWQYGGSLGGPIQKDKTHFFVSVERVDQNTTQSVNTMGLFPEKDGVYDTPFVENMAVAKITHQVDAKNYLTVRYGFDHQSQIYAASPQSPPESWGDSKNTFHSANLNLNSILGGGKLNEFVFQFSYFHNHISPKSTLPSENFPNGVYIGQATSAPQDTLQKKYQFRDDFTWNRGRHEIKFGAVFIYEPTLELTFSTGAIPSYTHLEDSRTSPISAVSYNGGIGGSTKSFANIPNKQYAVYAQDTWKATDRLTIDLGVRYDLVTGFAFDQEPNKVFSELQAAGRAGLLKNPDGSVAIGFEDFGKTAEEDKNNIAPRLGFTYDIRGDGTAVVRGGAGRYYDFSYTNASILFAALGAQSSWGGVYEVSNQDGIRNLDGSYYQVGQPLPPNDLTDITAPLPDHAASPLIKQPYTDQANLGFVMSVGRQYAFEVDGVYAKGSDLGLRPRLNVRINGGARRFSEILPESGTSNFAIDVSRGYSHYKGISIAFKKRWDGKLQYLASYTLSSSKGTIRRGTDELIGYTCVNAFDPFGPVQEGPTNNDARHKITLSAVWSPGWGFTVAPIFRYRSKTPYTITTGYDVNRDGVNYDLPANDNKTVNQARGSDYKQLDLRLSKKIKLTTKVAVELIGEVFNLTNAKNPAGYIGNMRASNFGQATTYAGDFQVGEQRLAQFGVRLEF